jgi:hypothetical protein
MFESQLMMENKNPVVPFRFVAVEKTKARHAFMRHGRETKLVVWLKRLGLMMSVMV